MLDFQVKLTCRHCLAEVLVQAQTHLPVDRAIDLAKGWERVYYMPYAGNHIVLCQACVVLLKQIMAGFVRDFGSGQPELVKR